MADATIQTGEKLQLNFDVENRGTRRGSQTVELLLDGTVVDEAAVVLDSTETGQLVLETDAFSDDDGGEVFVVETVIGTRTEATFEVEVVAIPDDLVYQIRREEFSDPWPANIGGAEMSVFGLSATNGTISGGSGDHGLADIANLIGQKETFGIAMTIGVEWETTTDHAIAVRDGARIDFLDSRENDGALGFWLQDNSGNNLRVYGNTDIGDGDIRPVVINKFGNSADQIELYIGDMSDDADESNINVDESYDHSNFDINEDLAFYARNDGGSIEREPKNMDMGIFEINEEPYNESDRESFVSRRDEVS